MSAGTILQQWRVGVEQHLLPRLHKPQIKTLAALSFGMAAAGHCQSGRIAVEVPGRAKPKSVSRRIERLLANPRLDGLRAMDDLCRSVLRCFEGRPVLLLLDETPNHNQLRCLKLSVAYRKRSIPLLSVCYPPDQPPLSMPKLIWQMLHRLARCLPSNVPVTLVADRGLSWPMVLDCCELLGWHYLLRLQSDTRVRLADGRLRAAADLAPRRGKRWMGPAEVFKKAGWRQANLVAVWEEPCKEPWLLVSDLPASFRRCRGYCKRSWCEQMHRDEKSQGFHWQQSHVSDPLHAEKLVLLMALAMLLAISLGTWVLKRGLRRDLESTRRRRLLSIFQLGMRWLTYLITHDQPLPCTFYLVPP